MYCREFEKIARDTSQVIKTIPPKEYVPVPAKIQTIANLALEGLQEAEN